MEKPKPEKPAGFKFITTYANFLDVFGKGNKRIIVDRRTGKVILTYDIRDIPREEGKEV